MNHDTNIKRSDQAASDVYANRAGSTAGQSTEIFPDRRSSPALGTGSDVHQQKPGFHRVAERVDATMHAASEKARTAVNRTNRAVADYTRACESFVSRRPLSALTLAAASGAALALLYRMSRRRLNRRTRDTDKRYPDVGTP